MGSARKDPFPSSRPSTKEPTGWGVGQGSQAEGPGHLRLPHLCIRHRDGANKRQMCPRPYLLRRQKPITARDPNICVNANWGFLFLNLWRWQKFYFLTSQNSAWPTRCLALKRTSFSALMDSGRVWAGGGGEEEAVLHFKWEKYKKRSLKHSCQCQWGSFILEIHLVTMNMFNMKFIFQFILSHLSTYSGTMDCIEIRTWNCPLPPPSFSLWSTEQWLWAGPASGVHDPLGQWRRTPCSEEPWTWSMLCCQPFLTFK